MVPIIDRTSYTGSIRENIKVDAFFSLLFSSDLEHENQNDFIELVESIQIESNERFKKFYETITKREPSIDAPFVNDNYLLFLLILGCKKYNIEPSWISKVLEIRNSTSEETKLISTSYKNIIADNYSSSANNFGIIISFEVLLNSRLTSWNERKLFYQEIVNKSFPFYSDDLLNITSLKAYDIVILEGDESRESKYNDLLNFESRFISKIDRSSQILQWIISLLLFGIFIFAYYEYLWFKNLVKENFIFASLLGFGSMAASFFFKGKLRNLIRDLLYQIFGYEDTNRSS